MMENPVSENKRTQILALARSLPHGRRINGIWMIRDTGSTIQCANFSQVMDDDGTFVGNAHFYLVIPWRNPLHYSLHFEHKSIRLARKYEIREEVLVAVKNCGIFHTYLEGLLGLSRGDRHHPERRKVV
jgi:hypothetical protein